MKRKKQLFISSLLLTLLLFSTLTTPLTLFDGNKAENTGNTEQTASQSDDTQTHPNQESSRFNQIQDKVLKQQPQTTSSDPETITTQSSNDLPGKWWDTNWEYRQNITIKEPNVVQRKNWPVDVFLSFSPAAYKYSIRVINTTSGNEIPSQPWNLTYAKEGYLSSATVTFLADLPRNAQRTYQIYWSTNPTDPPPYTPKLRTEKDDTYIIESRTTGYTIRAGPPAGGKVINVTHLNGDQLEQNISHFGITKNPSTAYGDYWGSGDTNNKAYTYKGFVKEGDPLYSHYRGMIFARYQIRNVNLTSGGNVIGKVNFTYTFYPSYWTVNESIRWNTPTAHPVTYYTGGWVFDQDDGDKAMFSYAADPEKMTNMSTPALEAGLNLTVYDTSGYGDEYADDHGEMLTFTNKSTSGVTVQKTTITTSSISWHDGEQPTTLADYFSTEYQGLIYINESGTWEFGTDSDDASELMVDGTVVASWYTKHGNDRQFVPTHTGSITLDEGYHSFTYRQQECIGGEDGLAYWKALGGSWDYIPGSEFYHSPENQPISAAESEDYYNNATDWNRTAFFHHTVGRGIGVSWLSTSTDGLQVHENNYTWYNEGNDKADDYIYWANQFNLSISDGDQFSQKYAVIPWSPTGTTPGERLSQFNATYNATQHPLQLEKESVERFKLNVTVHVQDKNERAIEDAEVQLKNSTSDNVIYEGTTSTNGNATFTVNRSKYTITVSVSSVGHVYSNQTTRAYNSSKYDYTADTTNEVMNLTQLVHLQLYAEDATLSPSAIQDGQVYLAKNDSFWINTTTDLEGWFDALIPNGTWYLQFNSSESDKDGWDFFNLTFYENDSYVKNSNGETTENTTAWGEGVTNFTSINITEYQVWRLTDLNITTAPIASELTLEETPSSFDREWGYNVSGMVVLQNANNGTKLNGTITWYIFDSTDDLVLDYTDLGYTAQNSNQGNKSFILNTSLLPAGESYTMKWTGSVNNTEYPDPGYKKPVPITISLRVDPASTSGSATYPLTVTWNENMTVSLVYTTLVTPLTAGITGATVNLTVSGKVYDLTETSTRGVYETTINTSELGGTDEYRLEFKSDRGNYTGISLEKVISVEARSTRLKTASSISIPYQYNYTFTADFIDEDAEPDTDITTAEVTYKITYGGEIEASGTLSYSSENKTYIKAIAIDDNQNLTAGNTYTLRTFAGKKNYENLTTRTSFELEIRDTSLTPNTTSTTRTYSQQVAVRFSYKDFDYDDYPFEHPYVNETTTNFFHIETATRNITGSLKNTGDGNYLFSINSTELGVGTWTLEVDLGKTYYASQSETVSISIEKIPTISTASNLKPELYWGKTLSVELSYVDTLNHRNISHATVKQYNITDRNITGELMWDSTIGKYILEYDTSTLATSIYTIRLRLSLANRTAKTTILTLTVNPVPTRTQQSTTEFVTYWGNMMQVNATYDISSTYNGSVVPVPNPENATYWIEDQFTAINMNISFTNGIYGINYSTSNLDIGTYTVKIRFAKQYYQNDALSFTLVIQPIPTIVNYPKEMTVVWGDPVSFNIEILNILTSTGVTDVQKNVIINETTYTQYLTEQDNGIYSFNMSTLTLESGGFLVNITLSKQHYTISNVFVELTIQSLQDALTLSFEEIETNILKTPITGSVSSQQKRITVSLYDNAHQRAITDATIQYTIEQLESGTFQPGSVRGTYIATIDWSQAKAGGVYNINVELTNLNIAGQETSLSVQTSSQTVTVDYRGGSIQIPGTQTRLSNVLFFIILGIAGTVSLVGAIKLYSYLITPPEVREIEELIEQVKQENYDYPSIDREEQFQNKIKEQT